jgi:hypothetical protein
VPNTKPASSRPSSGLSQNGSSGYGSTRSQVGPFASKSGSKSPTTESDSSAAEQQHRMFRRLTWGSMRGYTNRRIEAAVCRAKQSYPQFASLRIPNRILSPVVVVGEGLPSPAEEVDRELSEEIDAGIDLIEAEVEEEKRIAAASAANSGLVVMAVPAEAGTSMEPVPAPRVNNPYMNMTPLPIPNSSNHHPLRPAMSVDGMQVLTNTTSNYKFCFVYLFLLSLRSSI